MHFISVVALTGVAPMFVSALLFCPLVLWLLGGGPASGADAGGSGPRHAAPPGGEESFRPTKDEAIHLLAGFAETFTSADSGSAADRDHLLLLARIFRAYGIEGTLDLAKEGSYIHEGGADYAHRELLEWALTLAEVVVEGNSWYSLSSLDSQMARVVRLFKTCIPGYQAQVEKAQRDLGGQRLPLPNQIRLGLGMRLELSPQTLDALSFSAMILHAIDVLCMEASITIVTRLFGTALKTTREKANLVLNLGRLEINLDPLAKNLQDVTDPALVSSWGTPIPREYILYWTIVQWRCSRPEAHIELPVIRPLPKDVMPIVGNSRRLICALSILYILSKAPQVTDKENIERLAENLQLAVDQFADHFVESYVERLQAQQAMMHHNDL